LIVEDSQQAPSHLRGRHRLPSSPRHWIFAKRRLDHRRQHSFSFHGQEHSLSHLLRPPLPRRGSLHSTKPLTYLALHRLTLLRVPLRQSLLPLQQTLELSRGRRRSFLKIRLDREVNRGAHLSHRGLLHGLVYEDKMPSTRRIRKQRRAKYHPSQLHFHSQPDFILPRRIDIERNTCNQPPQPVGRWFQSRMKSPHHAVCHAIPPRKIYTGFIATNPNATIFLSAGEASGDHYGAQIIAELRRRHPQRTCFGLGGKEMEAVGLDRVVRTEDVAHMGITEVVRHMPSIYGKYRRLVAAIKKRRPDIAVLIDFPDVNFRLARELKKLDIPVVYFVSPQLWAWKRRRLRWVQQRITRMIVIFPFEAAFYEARGVDATFVGHPLVGLPASSMSRENYAEQQSLDPAKPWIALLPGSRSREVSHNLPTMLEAAAALGPNYEFILPVASSLSRNWIAELLQNHNGTVRLVSDAREALLNARASVVASGTATVQAAIAGNPFIVVYKVSPLTFRLAKRFVSYSPEVWPSGETDADGNLPVAMPNLIAGRRIVPEFLQSRFTAENVATALRPLLADTPERAQMIADLAEVRRALLPSPGSSPISQVCDAVEALLSGQSQRRPNPPASV